MPNEHEQFYALIARYPDLEDVWNKDERTCDTDLAARYLRLASGGEATVLKCLLSIWAGGGKGSEIDFTDLATLDPAQRQPLIDWLSQPFFP